MATKRLAPPAGPALFLELLHGALARDGYLSLRATQEIAEALEASPADVYSAATFYHYVPTQPDPALAVGVCEGPVCRLTCPQADRLLRQRLGIGADGRSADGRYRYLGVPCPGLCDRAPALFLDGRFYAGRDGAPAWPPEEAPAPLPEASGESAISPLLGGERAYEVLKEALGSLTPDMVVAAVSQSGLLGRGGAGFLAGRKWKAVRSAQAETKYVVCNADEGEPGTFKDRPVLERGPELLIAGMALAGYAVGAGAGIIYLRYEYPRALEALRAAIERAEAAGLLGDSVAGKAFSFRVYLRRGAGAYVCGEETSLLNSLEGKRPWPRDRPPFPTTYGLFGAPTLVNNVETLAAVPAIVERGADWFRSLGRGESAGTKLYSVSGRVRRPGAYELPLGVTARELVFERAGGIAEGRALKAFTLGGVSGGLLPASAVDLPLDYAAPPSEGAFLGSGGVVVLHDGDCVVRFARDCMRFFETESCGKCYPCRIGTVRLRELLDEATGVAERSLPGEEAAARYHELSEAMRIGSACGLGPSAALMAGSLFRHFRDEVEEHVLQGRCPAGVCGRSDG
ncbi:MAG: NADH-ubiquinone oxidoreductase-F iron-sulfur binding region domain-containing protein [Dehalococcoidia bacterium]|nr:NADH-ubiquinone oxidoreductase-F iron-sulfur binding region domain-containing protein [Dehalococcoidia bacterium]